MNFAWAYKWKTWVLCVHANWQCWLDNTLSMFQIKMHDNAQNRVSHSTGVWERQSEKVWNNLKCLKRCALQCIKSLKLGFFEEQKKSMKSVNQIKIWILTSLILWNIVVEGLPVIKNLLCLFTCLVHCDSHKNLAHKIVIGIGPLHLQTFRWWPLRSGWKTISLFVSWVPDRAGSFKCIPLR